MIMLSTPGRVLSADEESPKRDDLPLVAVAVSTTVTVHPTTAVRPLRVLHVSGRSDHGGGPEHILHLVSSLENPTESWIACPTNGVYWNRFQAILPGKHLYPIPHRRIMPGTVLGLAFRARRWDIDVIHGHGMSGGIYARLVSAISGIPAIHSFHGVPRNRSFKTAMAIIAETLLSRWSRLGIAVSDSECRIVRTMYPVYRGKLVVVPNGIHQDPVTYHDPTPLPGDGMVRIVSFTRANRQKNPLLVLRIARLLVEALGEDRVRIDLVGEGVAGPTFRAAVDAAGLHRVIRCSAPVNDPRRILRGATCYLSTSMWEGMPLAILEAKREGIPVVASRVVGNRDVVEHGRTGILYNEEDASGAAQGILDLVRNPAHAVTIATTARRDGLERHCRDLMVRRLARLYRRVADARRD